MNLLKSFLAWIANFRSTEEVSMSVELTQTIVGQPFTAAPDASSLSTLVPAPALVIDSTTLVANAAPAIAVPAVNTDTLRSLLVVLGHDVEADWEHVVALARKVF